MNHHTAQTRQAPTDAESPSSQGDLLFDIRPQPQPLGIQVPGSSDPRPGLVIVAGEALLTAAASLLTRARPLRRMSAACALGARSISTVVVGTAMTTYAEASGRARPPYAGPLPVFLLSTAATSAGGRRLVSTRRGPAVLSRLLAVGGACATLVASELVSDELHERRAEETRLDRRSATTGGADQAAVLLTTAGTLLAVTASRGRAHRVAAGTALVLGSIAQRYALYENVRAARTATSLANGNVAS